MGHDVVRDEFVPTAEQAAIVEIAVDARLLVVAPAGSGKTEVLRSRIAHLVEEQGVAAGTELLVLSFSRAAVGEMKRRLRAAGDAAAYVRCQTFDSFATRLLAEWSNDDGWRTSDYNGRIRCAVELLKGDRAEEILRPIRHVFVDEVQDLVGDRAALVLVLLAGAGCGFSLFGDPAQSIYGFQLDESHARITASGFAEAVRAAYPELVEAGLTRNYRARSEIAKTALALGPIVAGDGMPADEAYGEVVAVLDRVPRASLRVAMPRLRSGSSQAALLCRYNSQALQISKTLRHEGVPHRVQARATDRALAPWIALCLSGYQSLTMPRSVFEERFAAIGEEGMPDVDIAWRAMKRIAGGAKTSLDLERAHNRILLGDVPDELIAVPESPLVVSSIHRAKGLEFEDVYIVDPLEWLLDDSESKLDDDLLAEARVAYVALTRARQRMTITDSPDTTFMSCRDNPGRRWVRRYQPWMTNEVEVRGDDVDPLVPAGALDDPSVSQETQEYIRMQVKQGDVVSLRRRARSAVPMPAFDLIHEGRVVGASSAAFDADLRTILRMANSFSHSPGMPVGVDELAVECVDSVAGHTAIAQRCGFGRAAVWLRVRPVGSGRVVWRE